jgi:hypothetical protein
VTTWLTVVLLLLLSSKRFAIRTSKTTIFPGRAGGDRTHDRGIMRWLQTVGMVLWSRNHPDITGDPVVWCRSRLVESGRCVGFSVGFFATDSSTLAGTIRRSDTNPHVNRSNPILELAERGRYFKPHDSSTLIDQTDETVSDFALKIGWPVQSMVPYLTTVRFLRSLPTSKPRAAYPGSLFLCIRASTGLLAST